MQPLNLASSSVLKVFEHFDVDAFRAPLNSSLIRIVPTRAGRISAMQAVLALPHCEIYLLRTFPRIVDLEVPANHTVVLFSMVGTSDTIINGQTTRPPIPRTWSRADRLQDGRRRPDLRSRNPFQIRHACSSRQGVSRHEFARCAARTFLPKQPLSNISTPGFRQIGEKQSTATNWQVSFGSRFGPCTPRCSRFAA